MLLRGKFASRSKLFIISIFVVATTFLSLVYGFWLLRFFNSQRIINSDSESRRYSGGFSKKEQLHYVNSKGVHVVIGHYLGEVHFDNESSNVADELVNSNLYDPKPNEGENGQPVIVPSFLSARVNQLFQINRFNLLASDRISLSRKLPDVRKKACLKNDGDGWKNETRSSAAVSVVIVFHNEAWSTLLRTVTSVINRSPNYLLKEIILVDDASTRSFLKHPLDLYVSKLSSVFTRAYVIHSSQRKGLIRSRLLGAQQAKGNILVFLDAHCECTTGWLESLVEHVSRNRKHVACPVIDIINDQTFAYIRSFEKHSGAFNWDLHFRWYAVLGGGDKNAATDLIKPFRTPVMAGGLFAINKEYFFEIGAYDSLMDIWGGENLEMSFRIWQCGGSISIVPCSHVGHVFRKSSPYLFPGGVSEILYSNLVRVALVWMDEWSSFYFKFHSDAVSSNKHQNQTIGKRIKLRKELKCKSFEWYLKNVWPQRFMPMEGRFFGRIRHDAADACLEKPASKSFRNQPSGLASLSECSSETDLSQMFVLAYDSTADHGIGTIATDESICLDIFSSSGHSVAATDIKSRQRRKVSMSACSESMRQKWFYNRETLTIKNLYTNNCIEVPENERILILNECSSDSRRQQWKLESVDWK